MEKIVIFKNQSHQKLSGIIHIPENENNGDKRTGVNLLNPGLKSRVAPGRLNVKIARMLCEKGLYVFRFDPHGIGDSEGSLPNDPTLDLWGHIQKGLFLEDILKADEYFVNTCSIQELILIGVCGGAISAFHAGVQDDKIKRLILVDLPVTISSSIYSYKDKIISSKGAEKQALKIYKKKIMTSKSWMQFLTGKSNYSAIWTLIKNKSIVPFSSSKSAACDDTNFNKAIPSGLERLFSRGVKISFVVSENDISTPIFFDTLEKPYLSNNPKIFGLYDIFRVKNTNHTYPSEESQKILINHILNVLIKSEECHTKGNRYTHTPHFTINHSIS